MYNASTILPSCDDNVNINHVRDALSEYCKQTGSSGIDSIIELRIVVAKANRLAATRSLGQIMRTLPH